MFMVFICSGQVNINLLMLCAIALKYADWDENEGDKEVINQWEDDWDDDDVNDDFSKQLRAELEKASQES